MKVYLSNGAGRDPRRYCLGDFTAIGMEQWSSSSTGVFSSDSGYEIARLLPAGWAQVREGELVGPYYKYCDIEEN